MGDDKNKQKDPYAEFGGSAVTAQPDAKATSSDDTGVLASLKRLGGQIANTPSAVYHAFADDPRTPEEAKMAPMAGRVSLGLKRLIADPMIHEHEVAQQYDAQNAANPGDNNSYNGAGHMANMHHIASAVPILGPLAAPIVDRYLHGDKSGAVTDLAGNIAAGAVLPKVAGKVLDKTARVVTQPGLEISRALHPTASPTELITRAVKPSVGVPEFEASTQASLPELYKQNPKIQTVKDLANAASDAAENKHAEYQGLISPYKADMLDASPVGYAQMKSIPLTSQIETPEILDATRAKASGYMQDMPLSDLDRVRLESNAKLRDLYSAPGADRAAILRSNPEAARFNATGDTTRDLVYNYIRNKTGVDPAPINEAYGNLADVRDAARPRAVVFGRQDPTSLADKASLALGGVKPFIVSKVLKGATDSDALTRLAMDRYGRSLPVGPTGFFNNLLKVPTAADVAQPAALFVGKPNQDDQQDDDPYKEFQQ
jgi:hypothetical protein